MAQEERGVLLANDQTSDDKSTKEYDLTFPYSLISFFKDVHKAYPSKLRLAKYLLLSYYFQLFIVFIVSLTCLIIVCVSDKYEYEMAGTVLIVQAVFALIIVLLHLRINVFR